MSDLKPMDWSKIGPSGVPLPDWKIRIRCTRMQWDRFRQHTCPRRFDPLWKDSQNCDFKEYTNCFACWDEYVIWEDLNEADA